MKPLSVVVFMSLAIAPVVVVSCTSKDAKEVHGDNLSTWRDSTAWPRTVDTAADTLLAGLSLAERDSLRTMPQESLGSLHFTLGLDIRNQYGLWRGNVALLKSCGQVPPYVPDNCSGLIIKRAWDKLRRQGAA